MSYEEKYIKYKNKYLKLKELSGGGDVDYTFNDGVLTIKKSNTRTITKESIDEIKDIHKNIISVIIDISFQNISDNAFENIGIQNVVFSGPSGMKNIGNYAFANNKLKYLFLPDSIELIGNNAFANNQIENLDIHYNTKIGDNVFIDNPINKDKDYKDKLIEKIIDDFTNVNNYILQQIKDNFNKI
jgi:hypothetical protein